jgi:hypothetical protein
VVREFLEAVEDHLCAVIVVAVVVIGVLGAVFGRHE